jgi:hypothetical protein
VTAIRECEDPQGYPRDGLAASPADGQRGQSRFHFSGNAGLASKPRGRPTRDFLASKLIASKSTKKELSMPGQNRFFLGISIASLVCGLTATTNADSISTTPIDVSISVVGPAKLSERRIEPGEVELKPYGEFEDLLSSPDQRLRHLISAVRFDPPFKPPYRIGVSPFFGPAIMTSSPA